MDDGSKIFCPILSPLSSQTIPFLSSKVAEIILQLSYKSTEKMSLIDLQLIIFNGTLWKKSTFIAFM